MANAELVLSPEIDRHALKRTQNRMSDAFDQTSIRTSRRLQRDIERAVSKGIDDGSESGTAKLVKNLKMASVAIAAAAAAVVGKTISSVEQAGPRLAAAARVQRDLINEAASFGIDPGEYAGFNAAAIGMGIDQSDIRGMMSGFNAELEDPKMKKFKEIREKRGALASFLSFANTGSKLSATEQTALFKPLGDEDSVIMGKISAVIRDMRKRGEGITEKSIMNAMAGTDININKLGAGLEAGAEARKILAGGESRAYQAMLIRGMTSEQATAEVARLKSAASIDRAEEDGFVKNVEAKMILDKIEVKTIRAGNFIVDAGMGVVKQVTEDSSTLVNAITEQKFGEKERGAMLRMMIGPTLAEWLDSDDNQKIITAQGVSGQATANMQGNALDRFLGHDSEKQSREHAYKEMRQESAVYQNGIK